MSLVVTRAAGLVTVQDLGRPGRMHEAIPPGGAFVPTLLVAANRRAGNADGAPALEIFGRATLRAEADLVIATDSQPARMLHAGDSLEFTSEPQRVAYVAPRGGIDVPVVLGGRGALVCARVGPIFRTGDRIAIASERATNVPPPPSELDTLSPIRVIPGPDLDGFSGLLGPGPYRVLPDSDRVGTRLAGPSVPRRDDYVPQSRPMVKGAIEVPPDGQPIVMGPEHPATGGYPIIGVIAHADLDRFFAIRIGGEVRFAIMMDG